MLRSLFAGISGMRVNQTMLDVTGNNIANANTTRFKASSPVFQDTLSQILVAPSGDLVQGYLLDAAGQPTGGLVDMKLGPNNAVPPPPPGVQMVSYNIGSDGKLRGVFDDGVQRDMGQLAVADFANPMGLEKV